MKSRGQNESRRGRARILLAGSAALFVLLVVFAVAPTRNAAAQTGDPTGPGGHTPAGPARVVVADIDSGINVYHSYFYAGGELYKTAAPSSVTPEVLAAFRIDAAHQIELTRTGNFAADYAADLGRVWSNIRPGEPYWFKGTNVIAVSFAPGARPVLPDDSADTHGFGTAAAVLRANPEAIVLFVEGISDDSERYAFTHPEVDVVTTSYGIPGSVPAPSAVFGNAYSHLNQSFYGVVALGKMHFGASDNSPALSPPDGTSGPWWSIGVAGFEEATEGTTPADPGSNGKQLVSGSLPDFVADFTQVLPYCADCETGGYQSVSGTSFATPRSAGTASKIILEARRALNHVGGMNYTERGEPALVLGSGRRVTNWQVRRALERAAYFPRVTEYTPTTTGTYNLTSLPVLDPAPWATVGWGVITTAPSREVVTQALAALGVRGTLTRKKGADACAFMSALVTARHLFWDNWLDSQSNGYYFTGQDPYVYCQ
ncbi:MAG: S8 family serine peptidase [Pyrinomonadaceae bacterium]